MRFTWPAAEEWQSVPRGALIAWLVFYALFLLHLATADDGVPFTHLVNLMSREAV